MALWMKIYVGILLLKVSLYVLWHSSDMVTSEHLSK